MKKHRRCLIEAGMSSTALCVHIFPMHLEKIIEHYGTFQITDTDIDERLNGYIREKASSRSIRSYIPLGITSQNGLHSYKVTVYENVGPRDPGWNPSPGVWCMIKVNQDEQYFVKILKKEELPDRIKSNIISTMISSIDSHPSSKFFFVQYYKAKEIDEVTGDIILTVWEEDEGDSFGVEAQGSLWCEVKVITMRNCRDTTSSSHFPRSFMIVAYRSLLSSRSDSDGFVLRFNRLPHVSDGLLLNLMIRLQRLHAGRCSSLIPTGFAPRTSRSDFHGYMQEGFVDGLNCSPSSGIP
ncbi:hypothetical protein ADUPG1_013355 [Aduncisulcus paluster]|uniref:Uncharacterized protein n=1 Tax=Aduncisulcus paluster TaxID=2918883 RepID=A0ABQ5K2M7_9EUKA|nr:hypothetical protein ADUPG1_013355 [Aduncisulcus paluster]